MSKKLTVREQLKDAYVRRKIAKGADYRYTAPELTPDIQSDQVLALLDVLIANGVLEPSSNARTCEKCRGVDINVHYISQGEPGNSPGDCWEAIQYTFEATCDHLACTCRTCGYKWSEKCE